LPFVDLETEGIRGLLGDTIILRGQNATDTAVREQIRRAEIVHLATHGGTVRPLDSRRSLLQMLDDPVSYITRTAEMSDPLQHSELVLWDDVLTARDLSCFDLDGTALVVLSTCPGRAARWSGEGTFGMARAFFEAGAKNVVAATWAAHDMATSEFMVSFYRDLASGLTIPAALRSAAMRQRARPEFQHPFFWAQFSFYGPAATQRLRSLA
jgi:CHAT domain-containing protein